MELLSIGLGIFSLVMVAAYYRLHKKMNKLSISFMKLYRDYDTMQEIVDFSKKIDNDFVQQDIHQENFIKFLSDSRDWAFEYIEEVQQGLKKFISNTSPAINHFDKFGIVVEGSPHYNDMQLISKNFKELEKLLPEESNDRR